MAQTGAVTSMKESSECVDGYDELKRTIAAIGWPALEICTEVGFDTSKLTALLF